MASKGSTLTNVSFSEIALCDIIPAKHLPELRKIRNLRDTTLGNMINEQWAPNDYKCLHKLGLLVED
ncbi:MAG: hypothetical protein IKW32_08375 [Bacteroidaceae bacterium]|nr:hypothetical protein [Bacteroidaceae bacterium]